MQRIRHCFFFIWWTNKAATTNQRNCYQIVHRANHLQTACVCVCVQNSVVFMFIIHAQSHRQWANVLFLSTFFNNNAVLSKNESNIQSEKNANIKKIVTRWKK